MRNRFRNGVLVATVLAAFVPVVHAAMPAQAAGETVVVLSFDDGVANQAAAVPLLNAHNMDATFYVSSGQIGYGGWLSWAQLAAFQADGHEIGGHGLNNVDINAPVAPSTTHNEVCEDRGRLMKHGLNVTSFSYPYGAWYSTPAVLAEVQGCGYNSARDQWGLYDTMTDAGHCTNGDGCGYPYTSPIPPTDPYMIPTATNVDNITTLADLEGYVTRAQANGGGLVPFVFHNICDDNCDTFSTPTATLNSFLDFLATSGAQVKTMNQVIGGSVAASPGTADTTLPTSSILCDGIACISGQNLGPIEVTFTADDTGGSLLEGVRYTVDGTNPTVASPIYNGPFTVTANTTVKYAAWDLAGNVQATQSQTILVPDTIPPVSTIACNAGSCGTGAFNAPVSVTLAATDNSHDPITIRYSTNGSAVTASSTLYTGAFSVATAKTVKYRAFDTAGNAETLTNSLAFTFETTAPTSAIACNGGACSTSWSRSPISVSLSGSDNVGGSGLLAIRYTTNGSDPTPASTAYAAPFSVSSPTTVKYRAYDNAGNGEAVHAQLLQVDTVAPSATAKCNGGTCTTAWHHAATSVTLSATDAGGSGVAGIRYTTNGSTPNAASAIYTAPVNLTATKTVKFLPFDNAGNAGAVKSVLVNVDTVKPTVGVSASSVSALSTGTFRFTAKAKDTSKIFRVSFYVDRKLKRSDTGAPFTFSWRPSKAKKGSHTLTVKATDVAGNIGVKVIKVKVR